MSRWKKSAVLTVSSLAVVALAACGSNAANPSGEPERPGVLALLASDIKGSLQKTMDTTKATSVTMQMEGTAAGKAMNAQGVIQLGAPFKAELITEDPTQGKITMRIIDTAIYIEIPEADRAEMDGKRWMKLDVSMAGAEAASGFTDQLDSIDPVQQVKTLLATDGITVVGEETLDGVPTVHYAGTVPFATYLTQLDEDQRALVEKQLTEQGVKEIKLDLWVDEQYLPRRVKTVMGGKDELTVNYTDYGKPVTVDVPPAAETADLADLMKGLG